MLQGKTVCILVDDLYNDLEFWVPYYRLLEEGASVIVAGPARGGAYSSKHGWPVTADAAFDELDPDTIHGIVVPGGYAPDRIRRHEPALKLVRDVFQQNKPVAHICHAGWVLVSAGVLKGRTSTSFSAIKDDMVNAGANWVDEAVVVDGNLISSRSPDDLPLFCKALVGALSS